MSEKKQKLSLLDLKGKISFSDGYNYKVFRGRIVPNFSGEELKMNINKEDIHIGLYQKKKLK